MVLKNKAVSDNRIKLHDFMSILHSLNVRLASIDEKGMEVCIIPLKCTHCHLTYHYYKSKQFRKAQQ